MRYQGTHFVRRALQRAACAATVALVLVLPASALAQATDPDDLGSIILSGVMTGFKKAPAGSYNGPLDAQALSDLTGGEASAADFRGVKAYAKTWINKHSDVIVAFLYRLGDVDAAGRFYVEYAAGTNENGSRTTTLRELPRAFSYIDPEGSFGVVQQRGRFMSVIHIDSERGAYKIADAIALAEQQAKRFPAEDAPARTSAESAEDAAATNAGVMIGTALPVLLLGAFLAARGARTHRQNQAATAGRGLWPPPPPLPAGDAPPEPEPFVAPASSAHRRSRVVVVFLGVAAAVGIAACVSSIMQAALLQGAARGEAITSTAAAANDGRQSLINALSIGVFLATAVAWCLWQYRAHANLTRLDARDDLRVFTPGWAVGWWFVPFANLVRPYQAMRELADSSTHPDDHRTRMSLARVMGWWWGLFVGSAVISRLPMALDDGIDDLITGSYTSAAVGILRAAAAVLAIVMIVRIQRLQNGQTTEAVTVPPAPLPVPPPEPVEMPVMAEVVEPAAEIAAVENIEAEPIVEPVAVKPRRPRTPRAPKARTTATERTAKPRPPRATRTAKGGSPAKTTG